MEREGGKEGSELSLIGGRLEMPQGTAGPYWVPREGLAKSWHTRP